MTATRILAAAAIVGLCGLSFTRTCEGHWAMPTDAPVDRLVENIGKYVKEHPKEAEAYYRLGRVHSLAFTLKRNSISTFNRNGQEDPAPEWMQRDWDHKKGADQPTSEQLRSHLTEAIRNFNKAIAIDPGRAEYRLSLASVLEAGQDLADKIDAVPADDGQATDQWSRQRAEEAFGRDVNEGKKSDTRTRGVEGEHPCGSSDPNMRIAFARVIHENRESPDSKKKETAGALIKEDWTECMIEQYFQAFAQSFPRDSTITTQPLRGVERMIAYEGGEKYLDLVKKRGQKAEDGVRVPTVEAALKAFKQVPESHAITPIVFPLDVDRPLTSLLSPNTLVHFDLDGSGRDQVWTWVRPNTAILVWNPTKTGKVTSGRQLFGSVSWWVFFDNGYQALDALDDNRDGELTGDELKGIAVWVDRNGNGVSEPGEVVPVEKTGIRAIRVRATSTEDGCSANRDGIVMADGRVLPTYDWIAKSGGAKPTK